MENVMTSRQTRTAITLRSRDGIISVVRRVEDPTVLGRPSQTRQYELVTEKGDYTARIKMTRPGLKLLLRKNARIVGRVA